jgi:hypothetical protein
MSYSETHTCKLAPSQQRHGHETVHTAAGDDDQAAVQQLRQTVAAHILIRAPQLQEPFVLAAEAAARVFVRGVHVPLSQDCRWNGLHSMAEWFKHGTRSGLSMAGPGGMNRQQQQFICQLKQRIEHVWLLSPIRFHLSRTHVCHTATPGMLQ